MVLRPYVIQFINVTNSVAQMPIHSEFRGVPARNTKTSGRALDIWKKVRSRMQSNGATGANTNKKNMPLTSLRGGPKTGGGLQMGYSWHRGLSMDIMDANAGQETDDDEEGSPHTNIPDSPAKEETRNQDNSGPRP